ncbi:MAG: histidine--tRNA ligase [Flavisolibacter sp.]
MKPSLPQGTRDFRPEVVRKRNFIFSTIRNVFERYGFQPLETPAMENLETLMGKYGEEGDKLIFKILNNGLSDPKNREKSVRAFERVLEGKNDRDLTERALKYDLTIPFARYVAMNHAQLHFPFKRYQMQPVWRADRPQKGRYREFYQCDADVVGSNSLLNEVEFVHIYNDVFELLGIKGYELRLNSRNILVALAEKCGGPEKMMDITIAIDKLDKIGIDKVKDELLQKDLSEEQVKIIEEYLSISGSNEEKLTRIQTLLANSEAGKKGITELQFVLERTSSASLPTSHISHPSSIIDFTLARGLNYYTGIIFEAKAPAQVKMGSIGGGGRYDDLTGLFGVPDIPGVGISFGVDRIYDVMEELKCFPDTVEQGTKVLFFHLGDNESRTAYQLLQELRKKGIASEIFHETAKFDKQFKYAERKNIPYIIIIGSKELDERAAVVKDLRTGTQEIVPFENLPSFLFI